MVKYMDDRERVTEIVEGKSSVMFLERVRQYKKILPLRLFLKYVVSGVSSVLIQYLTLIQLVEGLGLGEILSSSIAFIVGCLVNYLLLYYWAFRSNGRHHEVLIRYIGVTTVTFGINLVLFWLLTEVFNIWYISSQVFSTCFVALINFILYNKYAFCGSSGSSG